jgi:polyferredoxin
MDRMRYPRGLIRYATQRAIDEGLGRAQVLRNVMRPRVLVYGTLLLAIAATLLGSLAMRNPLKVDVIRDRNALARIVDGGDVENTYRLHFMNAAEAPQRLTVSVEGLDGIRVSGPVEFDVAAASNRAVPVNVVVPAGTGGAGSHPIRFVVRSGTDASISRHEKAAFIVPR